MGNLQLSSQLFLGFWTTTIIGIAGVFLTFVYGEVSQNIRRPLSVRDTFTNNL